MTDHNDSPVQDVVLHTLEEVEAKVNTAIADTTARLEFSHNAKVRFLKEDMQKDVLNVMRELADSTISTDDAVTVYNAIADRLGWDVIESLTRKFTVSVSYNGVDLGEFEDIEADDEDSACSEVLEHMDVEASINFNISYNYNDISGSVDIDSWDLDSDNFSAEATEQD